MLYYNKVVIIHNTQKITHNTYIIITHIKIKLLSDNLLLQLDIDYNKILMAYSDSPKNTLQDYTQYFNINKKEEYY